MEIPVKALFAVEAERVPAGHFFIQSGIWFLAVKSQNENATYSCAVQLTGGAVGAFAGKLGGTVTYVGGEYRIEVRIPGITEHLADSDEKWPASIVLGERAFVVARTQSGDRFYDLDGNLLVEDVLAYDRRRFVNWEGWLTHPDGRVIGDNPLFEVACV